MAANTSVSRYRPAILILTGISATYAIYLIHQRYLSPPIPPPQETASLRRRGAIRRHGPRRSSLADPLVASRRAVAGLRQRIEEDREYEPFSDIQPFEGPPIPYRLLPSAIPTISALNDMLDHAEFPPDRHEMFRNGAEKNFLLAFFNAEFPCEHTVSPEDIDYLHSELVQLGFDPGVGTVSWAAQVFNAVPQLGNTLGNTEMSDGDAARPSQTDGAAEITAMAARIQETDGIGTLRDDQSDGSYLQGITGGNSSAEGQNMLNLLYHIAEDQAKKAGYIHRGVECNGCGEMPIQGVRYRCTNCPDFDLCENCEAMQMHIKTHIFYKIRIPAPSLGSPKQGQPVWYPGKPQSLPRSLPKALSQRLLKETGIDNSEIEALWDQFRCLAGAEWASDPNKLGMAIDRKCFDRCFVPPASLRPSPPNLIYDRLFAFYDTDDDGLIGFEEFLKGLASNTTREERLRRIFRGYDMDNDGFVDRKDFLRMFRAFYLLSKENSREMIALIEDDYGEGGAREVIQSSQPISSAFAGPIPAGHTSRPAIGKRADENGDLVISDGAGVLEENSDDVGDRNKAIADAAVVESERRPDVFLQNGALMTTESFAPLADSDMEVIGIVESPVEQLQPNPFGSDWPPFDNIEAEDVWNALGRDVTIREITNQSERNSVLLARSRRLDTEYQVRAGSVRDEAVQERWRRRRFYTDVEEGATVPPGYTERDSSDDEEDYAAGDISDSASNSRLPSPRSRSSSKVRFEDSVTDTDYETRSNTSSRSIPVGERWGGYEITEPEKAVGKEILYQAVQQGFNELLNQLFKDKEDLAMAANKTRSDREKWSKMLDQYEAIMKENKTPFRAYLNLLKSNTKKSTGTSTNPRDEPVDADSKDTPITLESLDPWLKSRFDLLRPLPPPDPGSGDTLLQDIITEVHLNRASPGSPTGDPRQADGYDKKEPIVVESQHTTGSSFDPTLPQYRPDSPYPLSPVSCCHATSPPLDAAFDDITVTLDSAYPDPTLPQHRPNSPRPQPMTPLHRKASVSISLPPAPPPKSHAHDHHQPKNASPLPTLDVLALLCTHRTADAEAKARGGPGKLSYDEFAERMVEDEKPGRKDKGKGKGKGEGEKNWAKGAAFGKLGFVGSWVEMYSF